MSDILTDAKNIIEELSNPKSLFLPIERKLHERAKQWLEDFKKPVDTHPKVNDTKPVKLPEANTVKANANTNTSVNTASNASTSNVVTVSANSSNTVANT